MSEEGHILTTDEVSDEVSSAETRVMDAVNGDRQMLTVEQLGDRSRFRFREQVLEIPEVGGKLTLKSLSVRERELLPDPTALLEVDDLGERSKQAIHEAAVVFSVIVSKPKVTVEAAEEFLGDWPVEAFDRVTEAYQGLVGSREEEKAAAEEFPKGE